MPGMRDSKSLADIFQARTLINKEGIVCAFTKPTAWFLLLFSCWWLLLAFFYLFPEIDIWISHQFFVETSCGLKGNGAGICGYFPSANSPLLIVIRKIYFYLPATAAVAVLVLLIRNLQHHGATYDKCKTRRYSTALIAGLLGPYFLVNVVLKTISGRPRPYETDFFGGDLLFVPAGSFNGACTANCSFISGEAAGMGWLVCLIIMLLPSRLRPLVAPPLVACCLVSPWLRLSFGGHYLSDVVLGFLSSAVVYAAVAVYYETQLEKNPWSNAAL